MVAALLKLNRTHHDTLGRNSGSALPIGTPNRHSRSALLACRHSWSALPLGTRSRPHSPPDSTIIAVYHLTFKFPNTYIKKYADKIKTVHCNFKVSIRFIIFMSLNTLEQLNEFARVADNWALNITILFHEVQLKQSTKREEIR